MKNEFTFQGWQDLLFLAKNYQSVFPNVLENIYTPEKFSFRHTHTQRTDASYRAFVEGLFGPGASDHIQVPPRTEVDLLLAVNLENKNSILSNLMIQSSPSHTIHATHIKTTKPDSQDRILNVRNSRVPMCTKKRFLKYRNDWVSNSYLHRNRLQLFGTCADST